MSILFIAEPSRICMWIRYARHWRHYEHDGIWNHQPYDCLLSRLFRRRSNNTSKLRVTGLCEENSPVTGQFPIKRASNTEKLSIWWRHHGLLMLCQQHSASYHTMQGSACRPLKWLSTTRVVPIMGEKCEKSALGVTNFHWNHEIWFPILPRSPTS